MNIYFVTPKKNEQNREILHCNHNTELIGNSHSTYLSYNNSEIVLLFFIFLYICFNYPDVFFIIHTFAVLYYPITHKSTFRLSALNITIYRILCELTLFICNIQRSKYPNAFSLIKLVDSLMRRTYNLSVFLRFFPFLFIL